jgi:hypothetical protein
MTIVSNTLCRLQIGLAFESLPQAVNPNQDRVVLEKNLFAQTPVIAKVIASSGEQVLAGQLIQSSGNVRDPSSQEGNIILNAFAAGFPPLPQDPSDIQRFLRYPKNSPLADHGSPGVPPEE